MSKPKGYWVDIDLVEEPTDELRSVSLTSVEYVDVRNSMKRDGFWESRPIEVTKRGKSIIRVDGLHRVTAARELGLRQVFVCETEKPLKDDEVLERAIVNNATVVPTKPVSYARALRKLEEKGRTIHALAKSCGKSDEWVAKMLRLTNLPPQVGEMVDDGKIRIANAEGLADLARKGINLTDKIIDQATDEDAAAFRQVVAALLEATPKKGPVARFRPIEDVKAEIERALKINDPPGYIEALLWVTRQDPVSAEVDAAIDTGSVKKYVDPRGRKNINRDGGTRTYKGEQKTGARR